MFHTLVLVLGLGLVSHIMFFSPAFAVQADQFSYTLVNNFRETGSTPREDVSNNKQQQASASEIRHSGEHFRSSNLVNPKLMEVLLKPSENHELRGEFAD